MRVLRGLVGSTHNSTPLEFLAPIPLDLLFRIFPFSFAIEESNHLEKKPAPSGLFNALASDVEVKLGDREERKVFASFIQKELP